MLCRAPCPNTSDRRRWRCHTFVLARAATYATLFVGLLLVFLPRRILQSSGIVPPATFGFVEVAGVVVGVAGGALALWCILAFAIIGKGTPAPFDPPRQLVVVGPYRYVRNPMYIGAGLALAGAAIFYRSLPLLGYLGLFLLATHAFVVLYEEPTLTRLFGQQYRDYQTSVRRWLPRLVIEKEESVDKNLLNILVWLLFLGGLFGMTMGMVKFFNGGTPAEYGVMGIGGGFYLLSSAVVIFIRRRTGSS
jgi:protein-S-isoprenylcysteine O-methyltransferase Ste14